MAALKLCDCCFEITQHFFKVAFGNGGKFLRQELHAVGIQICNKRFRFSLCQLAIRPFAVTWHLAHGVILCPNLCIQNSASNFTIIDHGILF